MKRVSVMGILTVGLLIAGSPSTPLLADESLRAGWQPFDSAPSVAVAQGRLAAESEGQPPAQGQQKETTAGKQATGAAQQARLGTIRLPRNVMADGKPLAAGTYQLRLTGEEATPTPPGQTPGAERWVEFVRGGKVVGRELASVVPDSEIAQIAEGHGKPARNGQRVDLLKSQKYWRVWVHRGDTHYLIHLPPA